MMAPSSSSDSSSRNPSAAPTASRLTHRPADRSPNPDSPSSSNTDSAPIPDEEQGADLPLTMSASVVLTSLPRDAHQALADVEAIDKGKGKYSTLNWRFILQSLYVEYTARACSNIANSHSSLPSSAFSPHSQKSRF